MKESIHKALNHHLELEYEAFHTYLSMAIWLDLHDLPGFSGWMRQQSMEELAHAHKIVDHMLDRGQQPTLPAIPKPSSQWESVLALVGEVLESERRVTQSIGALFDLARKESDQAAQIMLQWFVTEQVEEENVVASLLGRLRLAGDSGVGLLFIDQELGRGPVPGAMAPSE